VVARLLHLCRLGLDGAVPDHSTFSKNRHGRFRESDLLRKVFETTVQRCIDEGLVGGEGFAVDTLVRLNILPARSVTICEDVASDVIRLVVGARPIPPEPHSSLPPQAVPSIASEGNVGPAIIDTPPER
jgi:Transposase domain (DUF772)